ncbi:hypothetical protein KJ636_01890 [Patescibacteria group bacterium]|nr:hypothetical protein [Patescibacteria group bacterium]MBU4481649.1 hypothetical protein [Patescibacteria group bacterium]
MSEKIKRIESIKNEPVKNEKPEQVDIDKVAEKLKNILEEKGAFDDIENLSFSLDTKEKMKFLKVKEGLLKDYGGAVKLARLLTTKERWEKDGEEWAKKQDKLWKKLSETLKESEKKELGEGIKGVQGMIKLANDILRKSGKAIEEKLKKLGLLK